MSGLKKGQLLTLKKEIKGSDYTIKKGESLFIMKGGKNATFITMVNGEIVAFRVNSSDIMNFAEVIENTTNGKMEKELSQISFKKVSYLETSCGICFRAEVYLNGKKAGFIENKGRGGATEARAYEKQEKDNLKNVVAILEKYVNKFSENVLRDSLGEKIECFLNYKQSYEYVFLTFEEYCLQQGIWS